MKISEFAQKTGLSKDTIRYYEKLGLIQPEMKTHHRIYDKNDLETIEVIIKLKNVDFSLQEIKTLFNWSKNINPDVRPTTEEVDKLERMKELFRNKYNQMLEKEAQIKEVKQVLLKVDKKLNYLLERND